MASNPTTPLVPGFPLAGVVKRLLGSLSIFTLLMTIPQVLTIWITRQTAGVSVLSRGAYLVSAVVWLWYGLRAPY